MRKIRLTTLLQLFPTLLAPLMAVPCIAQAQEWAQMNGGAFEVPVTVLSAVKETLQDHVAPKLNTHEEWSAFLLQYRPVYAQGHRALEIHGSCRFGIPSFNVHSEFYDETVMDGGDCYFLIVYDIKAKRYSNTVFHGVA